MVPVRIHSTENAYCVNTREIPTSFTTTQKATGRVFSIETAYVVKDITDWEVMYKLLFFFEWERAIKKKTENSNEKVLKKKVGDVFQVAGWEFALLYS